MLTIERLTKLKCAISIICLAVVLVLGGQVLVLEDQVLVLGVRSLLTSLVIGVLDNKANGLGFYS